MDDARRNDLLLTVSLAQALARVASGLDDPEVCDSRVLVELLALADRAEQALAAGSVDARGTFCWRRDSRQGLAGLDDRANDLGRAWVIEADGTKLDINDGGLITRAEAERLAASGEYTLHAEA